MGQESGTKPQPTSEEVARLAKDSTLLSGGPGQEPQGTGDTSAKSPQLLKVKIGGKEFDVSEEMAAAIREREAEVERGFQQKGTELSTLRKVNEEWQKVKEALNPQQQTRGLGLKLFENPDATLQEVEERIVNRVSGMYAQQRGLEIFWDQFYDKNPQLKPARKLVEAVARENLSTLGQMTSAEAMTTLARIANEEAVGIATAYGRGEKSSGLDNRAVVETATRSTPTQSVKEEEGPKTLGEAIRARRERRRGKSTAAA